MGEVVFEIYPVTVPDETTASTRLGFSVPSLSTVVERLRGLHDPDCSSEVITQKLRQKTHSISQRSVERIIADCGLQKKLYALHPALPPRFVETVRTRCQPRRVDSSPKALESQVRQLLADKISGNQVGIWVLIPEFLRLEIGDLLLLWSGQSTEDVEPRMALHLINESALCLCSNRSERSLYQKGFEVAMDCLLSPRMPPSTNDSTPIP